jgi:putative transposase
MASERYRIHDDSHVYFVTYSVVEWLPIFISEAACRIVTESLTFCHHQKGLGISAYVIMPTHLHAIVFDRGFDNRRLTQTLADFRKFTGRSLSDHCDRCLPACFSETLRASAPEDRERRLWQPSRHPEGITTGPFWMQKADYLHDNPRRKGLVLRGTDWRFSSARYFATDGLDPCEVPISRLEWS